MGAYKETEMSFAEILGAALGLFRRAPDVQITPRIITGAAPGGAAGGSSEASSEASSTQTAKPPFTSPEGFIAAIAPAAITSMRASKIPASFTVAEAALETGWGAHCPGRNLFGIKADPGWAGASTLQITHEFVDGKTETIAARFRSYPNWLGSIQDHALFLTGNPRYKAAFDTMDGEKFAAAVARAGYATDPQYAGKICAIIDAHHLLALDKGLA
jgi:flagellum-specific peptidoglycan hydrolase FlgJ